MSELLTDKSCCEFTNLLASKAPAPGGGGAAALVGALGVALCSMAGNLTLGRKKYADVECDVQRLLEQCVAVRTRLIELVDQDAKMFEPLSRAYSISKENPFRVQILERTTLAACQAPLEIMKQTCIAVELLEEMGQKSSPMMLSAVGCGALCCAAALESAGMNVFVNTGMLTDREKAAELEAQADKMLEEYLPRSRRVAHQVLDQLRRKEGMPC